MLGYTTKDNIGDAATISAWLGRELDILGTTITMTAYWISIPSPYRISVAVPMLTISGWDNLGATDMAQAASGAYDQYYQNMANALKGASGSLYAVRLGWEMNGNWYPWSVNGTGGINTSWANYIATFRRMANIFRTTVPGVHIEFCLNWGEGGWTSGTPDQYWPGDSYVDIISQDIYQSNLGGEWSNAENGGTYNLNWLVQFAKTHNVKIALSEWGASNDDGSYITDAAKWMNTQGALFSYSVYSQYSPADQVVKLGDNPNEQTAWMESWNNTYYSNVTSNGMASSAMKSSIGMENLVFVMFIVLMSLIWYQ